MKINIIALFGPSGCGKDTTLKNVVSNFPEVHTIIRTTTRPKRENEQEDVDYHFISKDDFARKVMNNELVEAASYNNWFYGTEISSLESDKVNIGVFSITAIECLLSNENFNIVPVYIKASDKDRLLRALNREENPNCDEICRRFASDSKDFMYIDFEYVEYENGGNAQFNIDYWTRLIQYLS